MPFEGPYDPADDRVPCPACDGEGGWPSAWPRGDEPDRECAECGGRGWVREDELEDEEDLAEDGE